MHGWKTILSSWGQKNLFSVAFAVSFREGTLLNPATHEVIIPSKKALLSRWFSFFHGDLRYAPPMPPPPRNKALLGIIHHWGGQHWRGYLRFPWFFPFGEICQFFLEGDKKDICPKSGILHPWIQQPFFWKATNSLAFRQCFLYHLFNPRGSQSCRPVGKRCFKKSDIYIDQPETTTWNFYPLVK